MDEERYLTPTPGAKWAISRLVDGRYITLHQDGALFDAEDAEATLRALNIPPTRENLDVYFPRRESMGRCPTLDLMELCNVLDETNPVAKKRNREVGV